jgi:hypothetical protein
MITLIEALNYRCLRNVRQPLRRFHVLVGPNASGKTTFLDVIAFLGRLVSDGLEAAVAERTANPADLVWGRQGGVFELAIEAAVPEALRGKLANPDHEVVRYEIAVRTEPELGLVSERVILGPRQMDALGRSLRLDFPEELEPRGTLLTARKHGARTIASRSASGSVSFHTENHKESGKGWVVNFQLGPVRSALGNLPEDESKFPATTWLKALLAHGVQQFVLNSQAVRRASPPGQGKRFKTNGSNLPWVVAELEDGPGRDAGRNSRLEEWVAHLSTALADLVGVRTVERPDDKHRYLMLRYGSGLEVPSWMASDGTLRMLALTLPAYLENFQGVYLIEEPENGIHPRAVDAVFQSLSSVYDAQILVATHSPVILGLVKAEDVLCFAKTASGASSIVRGSEHPALAEWRGETSLGTLFAAGVLS